MLADYLIKLATAELGTEEIDGSNCGPRVNQYKAATGLNPAQDWPWCAAFICWLVREAMDAAERETGARLTFTRPMTASAWGFESWSLAQDRSTNTKKPPQRDIRAGDIIIFTFSHIGIATSGPDSDGYLTTIEGNTDRQGSREGGAVWKKLRHTSKIRSRIRFTV